MKLYSVRNGYKGFGPVAVLVEADSKTEAIAAAVPVFAAHAHTALDDGDYANPDEMYVVRVELPYHGDTLP